MEAIAAHVCERLPLAKDLPADDFADVQLVIGAEITCGEKIAFKKRQCVRQHRHVNDRRVEGADGGNAS